jgi:hypothetical protein
VMDSLYYTTLHTPSSLMTHETTYKKGNPPHRDHHHNTPFSATSAIEPPPFHCATHNQLNFTSIPNTPFSTLPNPRTSDAKTIQCTGVNRLLIASLCRRSETLDDSLIFDWHRFVCHKILEVNDNSSEYISGLCAQ